MSGAKMALFCLQAIAICTIQFACQTPAYASPMTLEAHPACSPFTVQAQCKAKKQASGSSARLYGMSVALRPSVLYISAHQGTAMDMAYVCNCLGVSFKWVVPSHLPYEVTEEIAQDDWEKLHDYQCGLFDYIIVADTNAKGA